VLFVAPCAFGKTILFSYIAQHAKGNVLIIAHRGELLDQISAALSQFSIAHGFIAAGRHAGPQTAVVVASQQTLIKRLPTLKFTPTLIIVDEAHHCTAQNTLGKILAAFPASKVLGVTATPCRLSGEGLGDIFGTMVIGPTTAELTEQGYLTPARIFAPPTVDTSGLRITAGDFNTKQATDLMDKPKITGSAVAHYLQHAPGQPFVAFCTSIEHAQHVAADFRANSVDAVCIHGQLDTHVRNSIVSDFRAGKIRGLCSVDLVSEGFDVPGIVCGIMLRPTASRSLHIQQIGRCLRLFDGKQSAIILDHVGNCQRHGLPTDPQEWTLEGRAKRAKKPVVLSPRICPQCWAAMPSGTQECTECFYAWPIESRTVEQIDGELVEWVSPKAIKPERLQEYACKTLEDWQRLGEQRGYNKLWAERRYAIRQAKAGMGTGAGAGHTVDGFATAPMGLKEAGAL
jgi:superfamily II DNA or RNA helicase